ncbi:class II fructose-bisphosphate aldolase [Oceanobacillus jeddahense]|uniref:class II fructose-bisphosphate aldolase n=1 Tax=Oceanobacillus jeddahense TaxID=1462527 RepID=UPI00363F3332
MLSKQRNYGVAAPYIFNLETVPAAFKAARLLKSPIILDFVGIHSIEKVCEIARFYERKYLEVMVVLNLDHDKTYEQAIREICASYTSLMVDLSTLPFQENVLEVREIVKIAYSVGVSVEAELWPRGVGHEYSKTRDSGLTNPKKAIEYVKQTNVHCLAVAVGTCHGT